MSTDGESLAESTLCQPEADLQRLEEAVTVLLKGLGEDTAREGLRDTPKASAAACHTVPLPLTGRIYSSTLLHESPAVAQTSIECKQHG